MGEERGIGRDVVMALVEEGEPRGRRSRESME
jgi:hypothetical protein